MKKHFWVIVFFIVFVGFPLAAKAEVEDGSRIDPAIVKPLMEWVEQQVGMRVPVLPQVIASRSHFDRVLARMGGRIAGRPQSVYIPGTVYMDSEVWDPEDSTQVSLLVHELVHHAQLFMSRTWACPNAKETMAYTLQNRWLEQQGHAAFVNVAWINRVASCPDSAATTLLAQK